MTFNDDTLIAYLDGQLPDAEYGPLEHALKDDEALRTRLQALADSSELARRAFDPVLLEPVPPVLIAAIWRAPDPRARAAPPRAGSAQPTGLLAWLGLASGPRAWPALASVVVLGLGMVIGWQLLTPASGSHWTLREGAPVSDEALALALEVSPSGRVLRTAGGAVEIVASFEQVGGGHCREFNRNSPDGSLDELGIACRNAQGDWQIELLVAEDRPSQDGQAGYQTASNQQHEQADVFLRDRVRGLPLSEAQERSLIEGGWAR
ncbi:MAG: anti-sigma factor family protein [Hydrogenophaga sp.]